MPNSSTTGEADASAVVPNSSTAVPNCRSMAKKPNLILFFLIYLRRGGPAGAEAQRRRRKGQAQRRRPDPYWPSGHWHHVNRQDYCLSAAAPTG